MVVKYAYSLQLLIFVAVFSLLCIFVAIKFDYRFAFFIMLFFPILLFVRLRIVLSEADGLITIRTALEKHIFSIDELVSVNFPWDDSWDGYVATICEITYKEGKRVRFNHGSLKRDEFMKFMQKLSVLRPDLGLAKLTEKDLFQVSFPFFIWKG